MNRWWGDKATSDKQAADRSSRAADRNSRQAREVLAAQQVLSSDDDADYHDPDTSVHLPDLDGNDSDGSDSSSVMDAQEVARQRALPVEDADFPSHEDAWKKELKIKFEFGT